MKNITKVFVVLLVVSIIFVTYQSFYLEGFKQESVPSCGVSEDNTGAPACYSTVKKDYDGFSDVMKSDYILKTQIVTPVCPNSPQNWDKKDKDDGPKNDFKPRNDFIPPKVDVSSNPLPITKEINQASYKEGLPILNNQPISDYNISIPKVDKPPEPSCNDDKKSQPSTCPPCPACKRCPEPVVDCKKIVRYKDAGADRLPVPLITDFSKF